MRRASLLRRIGEAANVAGVEWGMMGQGAKHEKWRCGLVTVLIPRHREINDLTAEGIFRSLEPALGKGWWRR
jgi:hypothetical protein